MRSDTSKTGLCAGRYLKKGVFWGCLLCLLTLGGFYLGKGGRNAEGGGASYGTDKRDVEVDARGGALGRKQTRDVFFEGPLRGGPLVGRGGVGAVRQSAPSQETEDQKPKKGRVVELRSEALRRWANLREGDTVELPWFGEVPLGGIVHLRMEDCGWLRFGGELEEGQGSFALSLKDGEVNGGILLPPLGTALEIRTESKGAVLLVERPLEAMQCWPAMAAAATSDGTTVVGGSTEVTGVPPINTKPGARGLIYINFEGGVATDPVWNYGKPIAFAPAALTPSGILEVVARVAEDYAPFDMAVSTIWADYEAAPVGRRTRVMVTPTSTALPGSGGVAMVNAWSAAGRTMSSTVPAWVFGSTPKNAAEGVSHEVGHTLGLSHDGTQTPDGRTASAYYKGHGGDLSDPLSWAPIMGEAYGRSQTQWSCGEYAGANNKEDDIAILKRKTNGVGYIDESFVGVHTLEVSQGSFQVTGVVHHGESSSGYTFATLGGTLHASLKPKVAKYGNSDLKMEVTDREGTVLAVSDPLDTTAAQVNVVLPEGTYSLVVGAGCTGPRPWDGYSSGYSTYGALGQYVLEGTLENPVQAPEVRSPLAVLGRVGEPFLYRLSLSEGAAVGQYYGGAPLGVEWDPQLQVLKGVPLMASLQEAGFLIVEGGRQSYQTVRITVQADGLPELSVGEGTVSPVTTPEAPWIAQLEALPWASAPGSKGVVAVSGGIGDGGASRLRYSVPAGSVVNFWWKVSSESGCDFLECRVNGVIASDRDTGSLLRRSGVRDWSRQSIQVEGASILEFVYRKDFSLSEEQDRGWVAGLEIGQRPVFTQMPRSLRLQPGVNTFSLEAQAGNATGYQWKKDGVSLVDGENGAHRISGAQSAVLSVTGAGAADSGIYVLEARNGFGVQNSRRVEVGVPGVPVVSQKISAGVGIKAGDTLLLSVGVSCAKPFFVVWSKDGVPQRWTQSTVYQRREADASMSGRYSATVVNAYGSESAGEVSVQIP